MYAFDIHCNGFFPVILFFYFGNALMMLFGLNKVSAGEPEIFTSFTVALLSNGLNLTGLVYYFYLMFRGYGILPFVRKP